jgi:TPP-dependent 2-oxoacid decarboxylase
LVLVDDGAFQMTGVELSTIVRYRLNPVVVVLNNGGYGTERPMLDGSFNDVLPWRTTGFLKSLGPGAHFGSKPQRNWTRRCGPRRHREMPSACWTCTWPRMIARRRSGD